MRQSGRKKAADNILVGSEIGGGGRGKTVIVLIRAGMAGWPNWGAAAWPAIGGATAGDGSVAKFTAGCDCPWQAADQATAWNSSAIKLA